MFLVTKNNTYTNQPQTKQQIIKGLKAGGPVTFRKSRRSNNFEFVIVNGHTVAKAFYSQASQIEYLVQVEVL